MVKQVKYLDELTGWKLVMNASLKSSVGEEIYF